MSNAPTSITVLHVDDEPDFTELTADFLPREDERIDVISELNASTGLESLEQHSIDCVVSDYDMPQQDGIDFLNTIREDYPTLPFILFTGNGSEDVASEAISAGATDYLQKRTGTEQYTLLATRIQNAVEKRRNAYAEQQLRELAENTDRILYIFDREWSELQFINSVYEEIWGRSIERLREDATDFLDGIHPDDRDLVRSAMERMSAGESVEIEYRVNPDEEYSRWVRVHGEPIFDETGTVVRVAGFVTEITEQKSHHEEHKRQQAFADQAMEISEDLFAMIDTTGTLVRWNDRFVSVSGYAEDELEDMRITDLFPPAEQDAIEDAISTVLESGQIDVEADLLTKDGKRIPYQFIAAPLTNPGGDIIGLTGFGRDLSEQRRRVEELRETRRRFDAVFQDPNLLMGLLSPTGELLNVNRTAMEYIEADREAVLGQCFWETPWWTSEQRDDVASWVERAAGGEYVEYQSDHVRPDGDAFSVEGVVRPVTNDAEQVVSLIVSAKDITERREHERELERYAALTRQSTDVHTVLDDAGEIQYQSTAVERVLGYEQSELVGDSAFEYVHPDDREQVIEAFTDLVEHPGTTTEQVTYRMRHTDGSWRWLESLASNQTGTVIDGYVVTSRDVTERKQQSIELEATKARFRALTENTTHAVVTIDENSTVKYANDAVEDILGYTSGELVNESLLTIMPDRFHDRHKEAIARYLQEGTKRLEWDWIELPGLHSDGHEVPLGISFGEDTIDGEQRFTALIRDITDQKERKLELERTRDLLQQTERIADVGGWEIDPDTLEVFWTNHLFELVGVDYDEEPPLDEVLDIYHEEDRPVVETAVERALDSGESFDVEARFRRPDGETRWLRIRGMPTVEDGEVVTLRGAVQDITDQRQRERILREIHGIISNRHRSFEGQVQALLELGRTELDTEYGTLSRIRGDEYVFEFVDADDDSIQPGDIVPVSATNCEIVSSTERTLVLGDVERDAPEETDRAGFTEWGISCYIGAPVFVEDEVYGTFCFYDTEARTDQFSDWEETVVDLMSSWVSYELQRRQANERLQKQNEQLEQFASIVSHDLRNPLTVLSGRIKQVEETGETKHLGECHEAVERMDQLIDDVLTLAKQGQQIESTECVELDAVASQCWDTVETRTASLSVETDRTIQADQSRLRQLFENLYRNAVEHGGDAVTITVGDLQTGFYIADDGAGIPGEHRDKVLESGFSTSSEGTGLGLSIVTEVVAAHGWEIHVRESESDGARFDITGVE